MSKAHVMQFRDDVVAIDRSMMDDEWQRIIENGGFLVSVAVFPFARLRRDSFPIHSSDS
jgi:hypothetical protein